MDEGLDAVIGPHPPLSFANVRRQRRFEIDPIRLDAFVNAGIRFDPVTIDIACVGLLGAEAPININLLDARRPERPDGGAEALQKPPAPRCETKALRYFLQSRLMIARRQSASVRIERRNQARSIISDTN